MGLEGLGLSTGGLEDMGNVESGDAPVSFGQEGESTSGVRNVPEIEMVDGLAEIDPVAVEDIKLTPEETDLFEALQSVSDDEGKGLEMMETMLLEVEGDKASFFTEEYLPGALEAADDSVKGLINEGEDPFTEEREQLTNLQSALNSIWTERNKGEIADKVQVEQIDTIVSEEAAVEEEPVEESNPEPAPIDPNSAKARWYAATAGRTENIEKDPPTQEHGGFNQQEASATSEQAQQQEPSRPRSTNPQAAGADIDMGNSQWNEWIRGAREDHESWGIGRGSTEQQGQAPGVEMSSERQEELMRLSGALEVFFGSDIPSPGATYEDLRSIYREKAKELHTDVGGDNVEMQELNEAWEIIKELGEYPRENTVE